MGEAGFLTDDEKRAATGYEPLPPAPLFVPGSVVAPLAKYDPNQPRVPGGNPDGGQWTSGGEGESGLGSSGDESSDSEITLVSQDDERNYRVDLMEEEERGGHVIEKHVRKSESYLKARVEREAQAIVDRGDDFRGLSVGSFSSLESATKLVNSTLAQNRALVEKVASGEEQVALVRSRFNSITGKEAYLARFHSQPYIRDTYGVGVFIIHDPRNPNGFRVHTAYPVN